MGMLPKAPSDLVSSSLLCQGNFSQPASPPPSTQSVQLGRLSDVDLTHGAKRSSILRSITAAELSDTVPDASSPLAVNKLLVQFVSRD